MFANNNAAHTALQGPVTGTVTSKADNMGLPGATIIVKGTQINTITDMDGNFSIDVTDPNAILVVSYMGFVTQEIAVAGKSIINVSLEESSTVLNEVVVIGYGNQKKELVTTAVASVSAKDFNKGSVQDVGQLIQGKVAGLSVSLNSGDPTGGTQVTLRGTNTIGGSNTNPLVLIDGIPGDFNTVAPQDIESISVLKDGSAAAIYGTRGTNGVILVTTKRASGSNINRVTYTAMVSTQQITRKYDMLTAKDYRNEIAAGTRPATDDGGANTDWLDAITQTPITHTHNLTFRGGDNKTNYLATLNVRKMEGIFLKSDNNIYTGRVDINHAMFDDKLRINLGILNRSGNYTSTGDGYGFNGYVYRQALIRNPTSPVQYADGSYDSPGDVGNFNYDNPVGRLKESTGENRNNFSRLSGRLDYLPIEGLKLSAVVSYSRYNETRGYSETKNNISNLRSGINGYASTGTRDTQDRLAELTAQYHKKIGKHDFTVLGGYSYQDNYIRDFYMTNNDFPTDIFDYHNIGLGLGIKEGTQYANIGSSTAKTNLISFFGRFNYSFNDKYLLQASIRREAASQLYKTDQPWGSFPAVSVGWRISQESFLKDSKIVNELKLRAGYGVTGNPNANGFGAVSLLNYGGAAYYYNGQWIKTLVPAQNPNPNLKWEEKHEKNIGLDFGFFNDRISGSVDYYVRNVKDLLYDYSVPTPPNLYPTTRANVGEIQNSGVELLLNLTPVQTKDFEWTTTFTYSTNKNKLVSLSNDTYKLSADYFYTGSTGEPIQTSTNIVKVGDPIGNFYGFKVVDIDSDGKWIYETPSGERKSYAEFSHATEDKQVLGNGLPKWYGGWNNTFRYKHFDLTATMRGAFGFQILNFDRMYLENPTVTNYNRLASSKDQVYGKAKLTAPLEYNSYYIENGDFWKIDNITLGYNFNKIGKYISSARIFATTNNTFLITKYKGIDPEVDRGGLAPGNDSRDKYPTARTYTIGLDVSF